MNLPDPIDLRAIVLEPRCTLALIVRHGGDDGRATARRTLLTVLAHLVGLDERAIRIQKTSEGKPYLVGPESISFNMSHALGYSLVSLSSAGAIGCDIENRFHDQDSQRMGPAVLHPVELDALCQLHGCARHDAFMRCWVRKESVLKAIGTGFGSDPRRIVTGFTDPPTDCAGPQGRALHLHDGPRAAGFAAAVASESHRCDWRSLAY